MAINATTPTGSNSSGVTSSKMKLKTEDFIKMMITQLQNQDPLEPAKNEQLLAQMSQIGQLQSSEQMQEALKGLVLQNNLGAASSLIGKTVEGQTEQGEKLDGVVNSIRVEGNEVKLELDNGNVMSMSRITSIAPTPAATTAVAGS